MTILIVPNGYPDNGKVVHTQTGMEPHRSNSPEKTPGSVLCAPDSEKLVLNPNGFNPRREQSPLFCAVTVTACPILFKMDLNLNGFNPRLEHQSPMSQKEMFPERLLNPGEF